MRRSIVVMGFVLAGIAGVVLAAKGVAKKEIVQKTVADLTWTEVPGLPVMSSEVWKGPGGSHCKFNKFPKGLTVPSHTHTKDTHAVVIAGQFGSWPDGAPEKLMTVGGYQFIPAGLKHMTKCGSAADCVIYECGPGAFDIKGLPPSPK